MTRNYSEEDSVKKGLASLAVALGASQGDVAQIDADGNVTLAPGNGGSSPLLKGTATLSSAQILALHTSPVEIVPVEPGFAIWPITASLFYKAGGTPYVMGSGFEAILWAGQNAQGDQVFTELAGPGDALVFWNLAQSFEGFDVVSNFGNVEIGCTVQNPTGGNGTCVVTVWYTLVPTT